MLKSLLNLNLLSVPSEPPTEVECTSPGIATSLVVKWNPPPIQSINGVLQSYRILMSRTYSHSGNL